MVEQIFVCPKCKGEGLTGGGISGLDECKFCNGKRFVTVKSEGLRWVV